MGLSPAEFDSIYLAYRQREETMSREAWERSRMVAWAAIRPHSKPSTKPTDILQFPWDEKHERPTAKPQKSTKKRFELISKRWQ